jgi:hypothetical protein
MAEEGTRSQPGRSSRGIRGIRRHPGAVRYHRRMPLHLYIYCKLPPGDDGACLRAAAAAVAADCGIPARLERRVGDPQTWLEVYGPLPADAAPTLEAAVDRAFHRHGLADRVVGGRTGRAREWFEVADRP